MGEDLTMASTRFSSQRTRWARTSSNVNPSDKAYTCLDCGAWVGHWELCQACCSYQEEAEGASCGRDWEDSPSLALVAWVVVEVVHRFLRVSS